MGNLVVGAFLTLDGVMQAPGGPGEDDDGGFAFGGWSAVFEDEEFGPSVTEMIMGADGFLLGRKTYDIFASYWPKVTGAVADEVEVANPLNSKPKWVASRTLKEVEWENSSLLEGDVVEAVAKLKAATDGYILTQGSANLIQSLLAADLVDEFRLWIYPLVLGQGKRLFADGTTSKSLNLVSSITMGSGGLACVYKVGGEPQVGSFELPEDE